MLTGIAAKDASLFNFGEKAFTNSYKTSKFTKVFSLESFPPFLCALGTRMYMYMYLGVILEDASSEEVKEVGGGGNGLSSWYLHPTTQDQHIAESEEWTGTILILVEGEERGGREGKRDERGRKGEEKRREGGKKGRRKR